MSIATVFFAEQLSILVRMDSFICGSCATVFRDIGGFLEHKKTCVVASLETESQTVEIQQPSLVHATVLDASGKSTTFVIINGDADETVSLNSTFQAVDVAVSANVNQLHNTSSAEIMSSKSFYTEPYLCRHFLSYYFYYQGICFQFWG